MYQKLNIPVLGLIENMSHFVCPNCEHESDIFGAGRRRAAGARRWAVPFLGRIPIYEPIRDGGDAGVPIVDRRPRLARRARVLAAAEQAAAQVSIASYRRPIAVIKG